MRLLTTDTHCIDKQIRLKATTDTRTAEPSVMVQTLQCRKEVLHKLNVPNETILFYNSVRCMTASAASLELLRRCSAFGEPGAAAWGTPFCRPLTAVPFCMLSALAAAAAVARTGPPGKCRWFCAFSGKRAGEIGCSSGTCGKWTLCLTYAAHVRASNRTTAASVDAPIGQAAGSQQQQGCEETHLRRVAADVGLADAVDVIQEHLRLVQERIVPGILRCVSQSTCW